MLKTSLAATLYTALSLSAIAAQASDMSDIEALRTDSMKKLVVHAAPKETSDVPFTLQDGTELTLAEIDGDVKVVNFWATWCAPCRKEMPALDALAAEFSDAGLTVTPIATGHNPLPAIERFFDEAGIEHIDYALDAKSKLARDMSVLGLPVTLILDAEGHELARLTGDAEWHSQSARDIVAALLSNANEGDN
ncbi:TlpA disulfide reductase family protein [Celeribacter sp.]|uniref:TlpA disulfide reductase family protein n=1 Tax=Celeribacter sp. TaxID=1890673 RepID=UPI003A8F725D